MKSGSFMSYRRMENRKFWETMRITRTDITLQTVKFPRFKRKITLLTAQQAIEMLENKLKGLTGYGEDDFVLGPYNGV